MIARFKDDHDKLRVLTGRLRSYLGGATPPPGPEFATLRWTLVRELTMHLAIERRMIEAWYAQRRAPAGGVDFGLDEAFLQHVVAWSGAMLSSGWDRYRAETHDLLDRLDARMTTEEEDLFPRL